jgi:hypothetical protein
MEVSQRGGYIWAFERFRSDALDQLLKDLAKREYKGLPLEVCKAVKLSLSEIVTEAAGVVSGGIFSRPLYVELEKIEECYVKWNDQVVDDEVLAASRRHYYLKEMRKHRQRLARKTKRDVSRIRRDQYVLMNDLDLEVIKSIYKSFSKLCEFAPEVFTELSKAVNRFYRRMDS